MNTTAKIGAFFLAVLVLLAVLIMKIEDIRIGKHARTETVEVHFKDAQSAGELRPAGEPAAYQYRYIVMPMRV